jgi:hypothetical protein
LEVIAFWVDSGGMAACEKNCEEAEEQNQTRRKSEGGGPHKENH